MNAADAASLLDRGAALLGREGMLLDLQRWDEWLALYAEDCEFWMPMWRTEETLNSDPNTELSHMYYASRAGLEDRIVRIRSRKSPASLPLPRTTHVIGKALALESPVADRMRLWAPWTCHVCFPRTGDTQVYFGHAEHELLLRGGEWLIRRKKVVLQNDQIRTMLDIYCV